MSCVTSPTRTDCYPPEEELLAKCLELGLVMRSADHTISHPPVTLKPFSISSTAFDTLKERQLLWNIAVDRAARHPHFLKQSLESTGESDKEFTGRLLKMYENIYLNKGEGKSLENKEDNGREGKKTTEMIERPFQPIMLGIFRTDYMLSKERKDEDYHKKARDNSAMTEECAVFSSPSSWKNVEINTISVSFAGLSPLVSQFHAYICAYQCAKRLGDSFSVVMENRKELRKLEYSSSDEEVSAGLGQAFRAWEASVFCFLALLKQFISVSSLRAEKFVANETSANTSPPIFSPNTCELIPVVVVVIQEGERNTGDQYKLLLRLLQKEGIMHIRRTLQSLHQTMRLVSVRDIVTSCSGFALSHPSLNFSTTTTTSSSLLLPPPFALIEEKYVASVVYFRSCYTPTDFLNDACWEARETLERCNAVKCPSLPHHLMTWKKVQQRLTNVEEVLEAVAFQGCREDAEKLASHFMGQYALNREEEDLCEAPEKGMSSNKNTNPNELTAAAVNATHPLKDVEDRIQEAIDHPHRYVLKPQLEGGGNLFAGEKMRELLQSATLDKDPELYRKIRHEFILMERIDSPLRDVGYFRQEKLNLPIPMSSELGIFGVILSDGTMVEVKEPKQHSSGTQAERPNEIDYPYYLNTFAGYVVRSKPEGEDDGGVMAGIACLDSLAII